MRVAIPFAAFFLSGASSLIFQTLWTRLLHHVFGSTSVAMSSVLTAFMAGLGLGAFLAGRYAERLRRPLLFYAVAEVGVAIFGILIPMLVDTEGWLAGVNAYLRNELGAESTGFLVARFLCIFPILVVPTTLMGATLPLLTRHFIHKEASLDAASVGAGALYAINTAGAVLGTFLGGFVLMPLGGLSAANGVAVSMNAVLGVVVAAFALRTRHVSASVAPSEDQTEASPPTAKPAAARISFPPAPVGPPLEPFAQSSSARRLALLAFAVSGATALCYEVVWSRALAMVLGSSIYSFTLILMTFLTGIAAGSAYLSSCLASRPNLYTNAFAATVLAALAHAPLGVHHGSTAWGLVMVLCALLIFGIARLLRDRGIPRRATTIMLAVPIVSSIAEAFAISGDFSQISLSVNLTIAAFLLLPLFLGKRPFTLLAVIQAFIGAATFVSYVWQDEIPGAFARLVAGMDDLPNRVGSVQFFMFLTASLCTLPATLGMGAMFPLTLRLWTRGGGRIASHVGTVYTVNTLGSIVGAWLPGFVLLPTIGMERTLHLGIALNLTLGAALLALALWRTVVAAAARRFVAAGAVLALLVAPAMPLALWAATRGETSALRWRESDMTLGAFRVSRMRTLLQVGAAARPEVVYYKDGVSTTVSVERVAGRYSLKNNGKAEASDVPGGDMITQIGVAAVPLLLHPRGPEGLDVAVIGFGSGVTAGAALRFPVRSVDAIELEPAVLEASRYFAHVNGMRYSETPPYASAPRLRILQDDGRNYLASSNTSYDLIVSEPSNPWITGVSDLFTAEHFRISKRRLKKGGLYAQWMQLYEVSPENIKIIYRTFASQFAHVRVLASAMGVDDTILIGSDEPIVLDPNKVEQRLSLPDVAAMLRQCDVHNAYDVFARLLLKDKDEVLAFTQIEERREGGRWVRSVASHNCGPVNDDLRRTPVPINTDDNARVEFAAPRDLIGYERFAGYTDTLYDETWPYGRYDAVPAAAGARPDAKSHAEMSLSLLGHGRVREATLLLEQAPIEGETGELEIALRVLEALTAEAPDDPEFKVSAAYASRPLTEPDIEALQRLFDLAYAATGEGGDPEAAIAQLDDARKKNPVLDVPAVRFLKGYLVWLARGAELEGAGEAATLLSDLALQNEPYARDHPEVYYFAARAYESGNNLSAAVRWMRRYAELTAEAEAAREAAAGAQGAQPGDADEDPGAAEPNAPGARDPRNPSPRSDENEGPDGAAIPPEASPNKPEKGAPMRPDEEKR
jgi:predicted membrane-bound spermidine synthase